MITNPMQFIQMLRSGGNPEQMMLSLLNQQQGNPVMNNILQMAQRGDSKGIEQVARNIMQERGLDFDKEFKAFRNNLGL